MASIRKRTWQSGGREKTAWIADYFDQDRKRHVKTFARERDAKDWLVKAQGEVRLGTHTPERASITVAEAGEIWIRRCEADQLEFATIRQYRQVLKQHIIPVVGSVKLARLSTPEIVR